MDTDKQLWEKSVRTRSEYYEGIKNVIKARISQNKNSKSELECEACTLCLRYDENDALHLAAQWDRIWVYHPVVDDAEVAEEYLPYLGIMTDQVPRHMQSCVWAGRRTALSKSKGGSAGEIEAPAIWKGYSVKDYTLDKETSGRICLAHAIKWADLVLTTPELSRALKSVIHKMTMAASDLMPRLRRPEKSIDKAVATPHTIAVWREFTGQDTGMRDLVLGHWHSWYTFAVLTSMESGCLLAASAAGCTTSYVDYVDVSDGGSLGTAGDHLKLALDGMSSALLASSPGARTAIWTATSVIRYRAVLSRDMRPWRASLHDHRPPPPRIRNALVSAIPDPLELINLRMSDGSVLASFLSTVGGTVPDERPRTYGATMTGYTSCQLVRLATSNVCKYNDITDLQSDITNNEAMNPLIFSTIVNGGQVAQQYLAAMINDTDIVLSCTCNSDMHHWAHDIAIGSAAWYALCPRYNALQQLGLYYGECPETLLAGLPILVTNASLGPAGSVMSNDQATFGKDWRLESNPPSLAQSFGIDQDGPLVETALRVVLRVLSMHDTSITFQHCLSLISGEVAWLRDDGGPRETGLLLVQLIRDLAVHFNVMSTVELDELAHWLLKYIDLTVEACLEQTQAKNEQAKYLTDEFCMRQARLFVNFYQLVCEMHALGKEGLRRRRFAVGAMSLFADTWKYGSFVGLVRYASL